MAFKEFKTLKSSAETFLKDFLQLNNQDLVRDVFLKHSIKSPNNESSITVLDTFNSRGLNNEDIEKLILDRIGLDINNENDIKTLNQYFHLSVDFLENILYKKVPLKLKKEKENFFENKKDVISFLRETEKSNKISRTHCRIAKTIYVVDDILSNDELIKTEQNAKKIIEKEITPGIQVKNYENLIKNNVSDATIVINNKIINFTLKFRGKTDYSSFLKLIYNSEYESSKSIKDPIGIELICDTQKDIGTLLNYFYVSFFEEKIEKVKNKNVDIKKFIDDKNISANFKKELEEIEGKRKSNTNKGYMDFKILGKNIEFRATLRGNKQKDLLKSDEVYSISKKLFTMIRLDGYITENYIRIVINEFYKENYEFKEKLDKEVLLNYLVNQLLLINRGIRCPIYTSKDRYETLLNTEFYPDNFKKV